MLCTGGCVVDSGFLDGFPCDEDGTCQGGYLCVREECPGQPGYACPVCRKLPLADAGTNDGDDGGTPDAGDEGGGDQPPTCDQDPPPCKSIPDCQDVATECIGGIWVCTTGFQPDERLCDGVDNDCDGETDNNIVCILAGNGESGFLDGSGESARFNQPRGMVAHPQGGVVVSDLGNHSLRRVRADGTVSTLAGTGSHGSDDGAAASATFFEPSGLAVAADGSFIIADRLNHKIRRLNPDDTVVTVAGSGFAGYLDGPAGDAQFAMPTGVAATADGVIYVVDSYNHCIRKIENAEVTTFAGKCEEPGYVDADGADARFNLPTDLLLMADGTLVVTEESNHTVRLITPAGTVTTSAGTGSGGYHDGLLAQAQFKKPAGCLVDPVTSYLLVADRSNHRVRALASQQVTTLLGSGAVGLDAGPPLGASFKYPSSLAYLEDGRLVIADTQNHCIRVVQP
jgi:DNA-binding beta-propeller fold protein YncE